MGTYYFKVDYAGFKAGSKTPILNSQILTELVNKGIIAEDEPAATPAEVAIEVAERKPRNTRKR